MQLSNDRPKHLRDPRTRRWRVQRAVDVHDPRGRTWLGEPVLRACASRAAAWIVGAFGLHLLAKQKVEMIDRHLGQAS